MSYKRIAALAAAVLIGASSISAASVRIDFADDSAVLTPGFVVRPANVMSPISDYLQLGSNVPLAGDGVDFMRITSSNSSTLGSDVLGFIVTMPDFTVANIGDADGVLVDRYQASFATGNPTFQANGFVIYGVADTGLTIPYLVADMTLLDRTLFLFGGSGSIESSVGLNLTNVRLLNGANVSYATLREFAQTAGAGASFVAGISSAAGSSTSISQRMLARQLVNGSSSGSIESVIPEPATLVLLALGAFAAKRRMQ